MSKTLCCALLVALLGLSVAAAAPASDLHLSPEVMKAVLAHTDATIAGTSINERALQAEPEADVSPAKGHYGDSGVCKKKALWSIHLTLTEEETDAICPDYAKKPAADKQKEECHKLADGVLDHIGNYLETSGCPNTKGKAKCAGIKCNKFGNATVTVIVKFTHLCDSCIKVLHEGLSPYGYSAPDLCAVPTFASTCDALGVFRANIVNSSHLDKSGGDSYDDSYSGSYGSGGAESGSGGSARTGRRSGRIQ